MADQRKILWEQDELSGSVVRLVLERHNRYKPIYQIEVDNAPAGYPSVELERAHLADLWLAILEQADSLEWASNALIREAGIRSVMRSRQVDREAAIFILDGGK